MKPNEKFNLIERYYANELTDEEMTAFKSAMENPDFAAEVKLYGELNQSLEIHFNRKEEEQHLRHTLKTIVDNDNATKGRIIKLMSKTWLVAAGIALLVGFFWYQSLTPRYNQYADHKTMAVTVRGDADALLIQAQGLFNSGEYKKSAPLLQQLTQVYPDNYELQIFYGISLMESGDMEKSKSIFTPITKNAIYKDWAYWELALLALKEKDFKTCVKYLNHIDSQSEFFSKAQKLKKKLR